MSTGVFYDFGDLPGFWRRCLIIAVDLGLLSLVYVPLTSVPGWVPDLLMLGLAWAYLGGLKTTRRGTLGYMLAGVRLVDLQGEPVGFWRSSLRFLFMFFGPINFAVDVLWLTNDRHRQTLRDKLTGTYVVRAGAVPAGRGPITYANYFVVFMSFIVPEVLRTNSLAEHASRG